MNYQTLKEAITFFFFPLPLAMEFLIAGLALVLLKRRTAGGVVVAAGLVMLGLFTTYPLPEFLLKGLEERYQVFRADSIASYPGVRYVVVLSGGFCSEDRPVTSILDPVSVIRLDDGVALFLRLKKINPGARLVVTGKDESLYLARLSEDLGVKKEDVLIENGSKTTNDQARLVREITKGERFFLVTSASHMPRAMALFKKAGGAPVPVPANYMTQEAGSLYWDLVPRSENVKKAETAFYEYMGLVKEMLAGNI